MQGRNYSLEENAREIRETRDNGQICESPIEIYLFKNDFRIFNLIQKFSKYCIVEGFENGFRIIIYPNEGEVF